MNNHNNDLEILIRIPPLLVWMGEVVVENMTKLSTTLSVWYHALSIFLSQQRNVLGLGLSIIFFYPVWAYCFVMVTTASTWVFWLLASVVMGIIQMIYVTYQFVMIATDIFVLTLLKTYQTMMRSSAAQFIFFFSKRIQTSRQRLSRRRQWRKLCEAAKIYQDYLRIPIWEKGHTTNDNERSKQQSSTTSSSSKSSNDKTTSTSPSSSSSLSPNRFSPLRKSFSFANLETLKEERTSFQQQQHDRDCTLIESSVGGGTSALSPQNMDGNDETSSEPRFSPPRRRSSLSKLQALQDAQNQIDHHGSVVHDEINSQIVDDLGPSIASLLLSTTERLREERLTMKRNQGGTSFSISSSNGVSGGENISSSSSLSGTASSSSALEFLLSGVVKRNHLTLEDLSVNNARSVALSGQYEFSKPTRRAIADYYHEVEKGLSCLVEAPTTASSLSSTKSNAETSTPTPAATAIAEIQGRIKLLRKMKQNTGRTALMLSGGGAQAMYHLGTIRALIQSKLYQNIRVVSGTSGGSIAAACCACFTEEEIMNDICVSTVSTDFRLNGEMKKRNIRWFPPVTDMISYWFENKLLVDSKYFFSTCEFYWGDITFAEAFEKTGKHVCIHVSASRASSGSAQRLLLNHISTPHVTLASAVAASCALPGVMKPRKLQAKNSMGTIEDFEVDGVEWIDGSVQADIPFQRISTLFNVSNYIVCQTNFHVLPFLNKEHHPHSKSTYWKLFQTIEWDIRNRVLKLSKLGLFPTFFGQDISKVFKQKYHGNITLVPRFTTMQTFGLAALVNPSERDMENYLKFGQIAAWPYLRALRDMLRLERSLDEGLDQLKARLHELRPESDLSEIAEDDDVESIASSTIHTHAQYTNGGRSVRFSTTTSNQTGTVQILRMKLSHAEEENRLLREETQELRDILTRAGVRIHDYMTTLDDEKKSDGFAASNSLTVPAMIHSEGDVFNLVKNQHRNDK